MLIFESFSYKFGSDFLRYRFSVYLGVVLLFFLLSFFFLDVSKYRNDIYYIFYVVPVVVFFAPVVVGQKFGALEKLALAYFFASLVAVLASGGDFLSLLKHQAYLVLLFFGLSVCFLNRGFFYRLAFLYFFVCVVLVLFAGYFWFDSLLHFGEFRRVELWGAAKNPVHASLMIMTAWVGFWMIYGLPRLLARGWISYAAGFLLMLLGGLAVCVFFQSRSAFLGFFCSLMAWLALGERRALGVGLVVFLLVVLLVFGGYEPLLERGGSYRFDIWKEAFSRIGESCSLLVGCEQNDEFLYLGRFQHAHSAYVSIMVNSGILGGGFFLIFSLFYFFGGVVVRSRWFMVSLVGWGGVFASSNGLVDTPRPLWVYFWIPTMLAVLELRCAGFFVKSAGVNGATCRSE